MAGVSKFGKLGRIHTCASDTTTLQFKLYRISVGDITLEANCSECGALYKKAKVAFQSARALAGALTPSELSSSVPPCNAMSAGVNPALA